MSKVRALFALMLIAMLTSLASAGTIAESADAGRSRNTDRNVGERGVNLHTADVADHPFRHSERAGSH